MATGGELRKTNEGKTRRDHCKYCPGKYAKTYCTVCYEYICQECTSTHKTISALKGHALMPVDGNGAIEVPHLGNRRYGDPICKLHSTKLLEKVCETCSVPVCESCVNKSHTGGHHVVVTTAKALKLVKTLCLDASKSLLGPFHELKEFENIKESKLQEEYRQTRDVFEKRKRLLIQCAERSSKEGFDNLAEREKAYTEKLKRLKNTAKRSMDYVEGLMMRLTGAFHGNNTSEMLVALQEFNLDKGRLERADTDLQKELVSMPVLKPTEPLSVNRAIAANFKLESESEEVSTDAKTMSGRAKHDDVPVENKSPIKLTDLQGAYFTMLSDEETGVNDSDKTTYTQETYAKPLQTGSVYDTLRPHGKIVNIYGFEVIFPRATNSGVRYINKTFGTIQTVDRALHRKTADVKVPNIRNMCRIKGTYAVVLTENGLVCNMSSTKKSGERGFRLGEYGTTNKITAICSYGGNRIAALWNSTDPSKEPTVSIYEMGYYPELLIQYSLNRMSFIQENDDCFMEAFHSGGLVILNRDHDSLSIYSSDGDILLFSFLSAISETGYITCMFVDAFDNILIGDNLGKVHLYTKRMKYAGVVCEVKGTRKKLSGIAGAGNMLYLFTRNGVEVHTFDI